MIKQGLININIKIGLTMFGTFLLLSTLLVTSAEDNFIAPSDTKTEEYLMPGAKPMTPDQYLCASFPIHDAEAYIYKFEAQANADTAHHMLLYGCDGEPFSSSPIWNCPRMCKDKSPTIMFAWAKNAPPTVLPKDVGLRIGKKTNINTIVLQIHYAKKFKDSEDPDHSGIKVYTTYQKQPFVAGIYLMMSTWFQIPPHKSSYPVDMSCLYSRDNTMIPFAYRTHAHGLGKVITGYKFSNGKYTLIGKGNPQWPQAFYPVKERVEIHTGDYLAARCTYDSTRMDSEVVVGATGNDEMCNFYIMFYTNGSVTSPYGQCMNNMAKHLTGSHFPADVSVPLPPNPALEEEATGHHHHGGMAGTSHPKDHDDPQGKGDDLEPKIDMGNGSGINQDQGSPKHDIHFQHKLQLNVSWPGHPVRLGQIGGVATDSDGRLYIFHRASRVWSAQSFSYDNDFRYPTAPINEDVLTVLDRYGKLVRSFGKGKFFMPHGIEIDHEGNAWLTDVAMHQVFKIPLKSFLKDTKSTEIPEASLVLGKKFKHGQEDDLFCKPTDVAVLSTGEFFVSDGYCNSRVLKFSKEGNFIKKWGNKNLNFGIPAPPGTFNLPHGVTVSEKAGLVCVADRENGRIQCFDLDGNFKHVIKHPEFGPRVFGVEFSPEQGGVLYAVNGKSYDGQHAFTIQGFTLDVTTGELLEMWNIPQFLKSPHDVCVDAGSQSVYIGELDPRTVWKLTRADSPQPDLNIHFDDDDDDDHDEMHHSDKVNLKDGIKKTATTVKPDSKLDGPDVSETKDKTVSKTLPVTPENGLASTVKEHKGEEITSTMTPSLIIGLLLIVPVLLILVIALVLRARKSGYFHKRGKKGFDLQGLLGNSHKGFDPLSTEESDHEIDQDDSDRDEYLAPKKFRTKT